MDGWGSVLGDRPFDHGQERPQDRPSSALELTDARIVQARHGKDSHPGPTHDQFPRPLAPGRPVWNGAFIAHAEMLAAE